MGVGRRQDGTSSRTFVGRSRGLADPHLPVHGSVLGAPPASAGRRSTDPAPAAIAAAQRRPFPPGAGLRYRTAGQLAGTRVFGLLAGRVAVSVLLVPLLQRVSVVLLPALEEGVVRVGVSLVVVRMVMMKFLFALLVSLLAVRSLLRPRRGRNSFLARVLGALHAAIAAAAAVRLPAARAERVTGGGAGQRGEAVTGGEQRGLGRKASQVEVIWGDEDID